MAVYGSRATEIADEVDAGFVDEARTVLAAEVPHVIRKEYAVTLVDVMHRRTMLGLAADQGRAVIDEIARRAATELDWDKAETARQLEALRKYNDQLRTPAAAE